MLAQAPISWAFKLDLNPEVKKVSAYARDIHTAGENVYIIGMSYSEMFYCGFAIPLEQKVYDELIAKGTKEVYCMILPEYLGEFSAKYNFGYDPIYKTGRLSLYKISFEDS